MALFHALIRTHHITSRKKVAHLRKAASKYGCYALLRSGGCPGIMYCKGSEEGVKEWVGTAQRLRYKDFQLALKPAPLGSNVAQPNERTGLFEVESIKEFAVAMERRGILEWWKRGMEFA
ncbi:hypothetical protein N657DRAFT_575978 [Parathielavia appendiculata]|uniref:Uncharacterized protein n=1 Tax=Parathielavia appendiculata TaxID=2587402 RepID=A0AAN6TXC4_9PEZI|nr:hypothetical protein N657DRAFT_575978 [Parathielavia appendiculata]